jgi:hypothetical protein
MRRTIPIHKPKRTLHRAPSRCRGQINDPFPYRAVIIGTRIRILAMRLDVIVNHERLASAREKGDDDGRGGYSAGVLWAEEGRGEGGGGGNALAEREG